MNKIRMALASLMLMFGLGGGLLLTATPAHASNLLGVPHIHISGACPANDCWTWITADGTVWRGNGANLNAQYNYVLVVCSQRVSGGFPNPHWIISPLGPWGPYSNDGRTHPYCVSPYDGNGIRWNLYPLSGGV